MDIANAVWAETDANNNTASPDGAPEGMAPSGLNDTIRADRGAIKRWYDQTIPKVTAGSSTAYTLAYDVAPGSAADGMTHVIRFHTTNGAAPTLNVNGLGAKPLFAYIAGTWMAAPEGAFTTDYIARIAYDSSSGNYRILGMHTCLGIKAFSGNPAVVDFTNIPTTAQNFELRFWLGPTALGADVGFQVYRGGVLSAGASDYTWAAASIVPAGGAVNSSGSTAASAITLGGSVGNLLPVTGTVKVEGLTTLGVHYHTAYGVGNTTVMVGIVGNGYNLIGGTLTGFRVGLSSGAGVNALSYARLDATI